ncbi:E3 ubiquitin ligase BIG BROTHER-related-like isoform X1 [Mangifera indica]|uniref:E3 ubiquitin ligase BIG BROTHER-related-like isoform X1 n=1 Tax=Mangifera indica TaxID=29780 RepID=UPI001CFA0214|nr:E3 ubiquitin ligase BIG BROTHER-related-like isoform X1 [Mangifera indica]
MDNKAETANSGSNNFEGEQEVNPNNTNGLTEQVIAEEADSDSDLSQHQQQHALSRTRTPFTNLGQVEADLALARRLQEQERAYMMLGLNNDGSDYGSWEGGSYLHYEDDDFGGPDYETDEEGNGTDVEDGDEDDDDDAFDVHDHDENAEEDNNPSVEYDSDVFSSDEAYARAVQDALARAGINDREIEDPEDHGGNSQDAWEEVDPDELSYEELIALGELLGAESRGLSTHALASLPTINFRTGSSQSEGNDLCVICRVDYEDGETLTLLSCQHAYHSECINDWLRINKVCPICLTEVSTSGHS